MARPSSSKPDAKRKAKNAERLHRLTRLGGRCLPKLSNTLPRSATMPRGELSRRLPWVPFGACAMIGASTAVDRGKT
jgi:hypothetical protein